MRYALALVLLLPLGCAPPRDAVAAADFDTRWHDGRAELDGYRLEISRYGEPRSGEAVMIFVTEPFSASKLVKLDDPARAPGDLMDVLKLNLVRDFQTGIYDYNTMVSIFSKTADFEPVKVSFASSEWCGNVYDELRVGASGIHERLFSYFEGQSTDRTLARRDGIFEDNLYILLRGLRGDYLAPGAKRSVAFLPSPFHSRLRHLPLEWQAAEIERERVPVMSVVPAGRFETTLYVVRTPDREGRFHIETAEPHRIVAWEWQARAGAADARSWMGGAERGVLTGSARLEYWKLHDNGDETYRSQIGLGPPQQVPPTTH